MEITTIKLQKKTKSFLDKFRKEKESYDSVIQKLVAEVQQKHLKKRLIEAYQHVGKDDLDLLHEWETASSEIDQ